MLRVLLYPGGGTGVGNTIRFLRVALMLQALRADVHSLEIISNPFYCQIFQRWSRNFRYLPDLANLTVWSQRKLETTKVVAASAEKIARLVKDYQPHIFITSRFSGLKGELLQVYPLLRSLSCRVVIGWRDVLQVDDPVRLVHDSVDQIIVFGVETLRDYLPLNTLPAKLRTGLKFVGYIPPIERLIIDKDMRKSENETRILCQVGGGFDGASVINSCVSAVAKIITTNPTRKIKLDVAKGLFAPSKSTRVSSMSHDFIHTTNWRTLNESEYASYDLQLSMAGYNTCVEAAFFRVPSILFPRQCDADKEQFVRAKLFCQRFSHMFMYDPNLAATYTDSLADFIQRVLSISDTWSIPVLPGFFARPEDLAPIIE